MVEEIYSIPRRIESQEESKPGGTQEEHKKYLSSQKNETERVEGVNGITKRRLFKLPLSPFPTKL